MTQGERASLERLEDKLTAHLAGIALDVKAIDARTRQLEIDVAEMRGQKSGGRSVLAGGMQVAMLAAAFGGFLVGLPAAVWYVATGGPH